MSLLLSLFCPIDSAVQSDPHQTRGVWDKNSWIQSLQTLRSIQSWQMTASSVQITVHCGFWIDHLGGAVGADGATFVSAWINFIGRILRGWEKVVRRCFSSRLLRWNDTKSKQNNNTEVHTTPHESSSRAMTNIIITQVPKSLTVCYSCTVSSWFVIGIKFCHEIKRIMCLFRTWM